MRIQVVAVVSSRKLLYNDSFRCECPQNQLLSGRQTVD